MNGVATRRAVSQSVQERPPRSDSDWFSRAGDRCETRASRVRAGLIRQAIYVAIDVATVSVTAAIVVWLQHAFGGTYGYRWDGGQVGFLCLYVGLIVLALASQSLYRTPKEQSATAESLGVGKAVGLATSLLIVFIFTSGNMEIPRLVIIEVGAMNVIALAGWRYAKRRYVLERAHRGEGLSRVLIVGAGNSGRALAQWFEANRQLGYAVCGFLDAHVNGDPRVLGTVNDFRRVALGKFVDQVFVALPAEREVVKQILVEARRLRMDMNIVPDLYDGLGWHAPVHSMGGFPILELHGRPIPTAGLALKRVMDIFLGALALLLSAPLLAFAAAWIWIDSPGPVFYSALRVGRKGQKFRCYKLRTMVREADARKETLRPANQRQGPFFKVENDPRVTKCGAWLRRFSVDELPQLLNVIRGDMSLVGPRPHPLDDVERYQVEDLRRLDVKPGATGLWQVTARNDPSFARSIALDLQYIENWSLELDLKILLKTVREVWRGEGN